MFLDKLKGFPLVLHSMAPYYAANPGIRTQTLATHFPFLEEMLPFVVCNDPTTTCWSPHGPVAMSAASSSSYEPDPAHALNAAVIDRLNGIIAEMVGSSSKNAYFGMSVPPTTYPNTTLLSESRTNFLTTNPPRAHYCWLHGWNNTHPGARCNVMEQNPAYTVEMRNATGPEGTGGNPRVGVPVRFSRLQFFFAPLARVCPPCLISSPPTHTISPPTESGYQR